MADILQEDKMEENQEVLFLVSKDSPDQSEDSQVRIRVVHPAKYHQVVPYWEDNALNQEYLGPPSKISIVVGSLRINQSHPLFNSPHSGWARDHLRELDVSLEVTGAAVDLSRGAGPPRQGPRGPPVPAVCPQPAVTPLVAPQEVPTQSTCTEEWVGPKRDHLSLPRRRKQKQEKALSLVSQRGNLQQLLAVGPPEEVAMNRVKLQ